MEIITNSTEIIIKKIQFKNFPHLKTFFYESDRNKRKYAQQEDYNDYEYWDITIFLYTRDVYPTIWYGREVYIGANALLNKVKEDDALLAEFFILRTHGLKDWQ